MKTYELTYIITDKFDEKEIPRIAEKIKKLFSETKILQENFWGRKKLAYPISKNDFGYFVSLVFEGEPEIISKIDSKLKLEEEAIIRHLLVARKPVKEIKEEKKAEEKLEKPRPEKPKELERPKIKIKPAGKIKPVKTAKKEKPKITKELEAEEKKLKDLDKKLEEILKG